MAESVKVIVRCRPINQRERDLNCKCVVYMDTTHCTCSIVNPCDSSAPPKSFTFDGVYHVNSTTEQIYNEIAYPLVEGVLEGYNGTVFAYGQTGCGKSFTMQGVPDPASPQRGIIPRAFEHIFEAASVAEDRKYLVLASYLEIYNEEIRDLLGRDVKRKLDLKENVDKGVYVQELSQHPVQSVIDCEALMQKGWKNRATGATLMNADSSRSHSIFSISVEMISCDGGEEHIRCGKLNLVDLAGSERQAKTGATGERLREATKINLSLSALGNVISALVDGKSRHIPYRDSKLTRLLQDSLGGNTKTLMIACLSPADNNYDETLSTLRYANRAKNIQNKPRINEDPKDTILREYQEEIKKLRELLEKNNTDVVMVNLEEEKEKVRLQYEAEMESMRLQYLAEQNSKAKLQNDMEALRRHYEEEMLRINSQVMTTASATIATMNSNCITNEVPCDVTVDEALQEKNPALKQSQEEVLLRLKKLQESMVGGERANDKELKERRIRRKKAAERRLQALAKALSRVEDDDGIFLKVYDDIQQELHQKTEALRKARVKMKAQEREILDLQTEFETERKDYLETIRRQNREIKLLQQILDKLQPTIKRECNYSNLDKIKSEALWNDDAEHWKLPDLVISRTKLPPAVGSQLAVLRPSSAHQNGSTSPNSSHISKSNSSPPDYQRTSPQHSSNSDEDTRAIYKKLQRSEMEDIAGNYFKPKRAAELLNRAKEDASRAFSTWKDNFLAYFVGSSSVCFAASAEENFYLDLSVINVPTGDSEDLLSPEDDSTSFQTVTSNITEVNVMFNSDMEKCDKQALVPAPPINLPSAFGKEARDDGLLYVLALSSENEMNTVTKDNCDKTWSSNEDKGGEYAARKAGASSSVSNLLNASTSNGHNTFHSSLNALNLNSSLSGNGFLNSSWGSSSAPQQNNYGWIGNNLGSEHLNPTRKPMRLEALPTVPQRQLHKDLNTMDVI